MAESRELRQQELSQLLLEKARQDLALVQKVIEDEDIADEILGFHVQHGVEKAIKAVLTRLGIQYEYTHDLSVLYQQVDDVGANSPASLAAVEAFGPFAVQFRYTLYSELDLDRVSGSALAHGFIEWAHSIVESPVQRA